MPDISKPAEPAIKAVFGEETLQKKGFFALSKEIKASNAYYILMKRKLFKAGCHALAILAVLTAFLAYPVLPSSVPIHWNAQGMVDGCGPKWVGAFLFPIVMVLFLFFLFLIPKIAVFKKNLKDFEESYWALGYVLELFFLIFYALTLLPNFGYSFNMSQLLMLPLGMLFISLGILMPSFKRNFFVGIRTPWTLANDRVWEKTHRLGGKLFVLAGLASLVSVPFSSVAIFISVFSVLVAVAITIVYSFFEFRAQKKDGLKPKGKRKKKR